MALFATSILNKELGYQCNTGHGAFYGKRSDGESQLDGLRASIHTGRVDVGYVDMKYY